jgi:hypothetical protein
MSHSAGGLPKRIPAMSQDDYAATLAAFLRTKGITRYPTACLSRTQGAVDNTARTALKDYIAAAKRRSAEDRRSQVIAYYTFQDPVSRD